MNLKNLAIFCGLKSNITNANKKVIIIGKSIICKLSPFSDKWYLFVNFYKNKKNNLFFEIKYMLQPIYRCAFFAKQPGHKNGILSIYFKNFELRNQNNSNNSANHRNPNSGKQLKMSNNVACS